MARPATLNLSEYLPATLTAPGLRGVEFEALCEKFPDSKIEYYRDGTITITPPTDPKTGMRNVSLLTQLAEWAKQNGCGNVTGPDAGFRLPWGSRFAPDACWFDRKPWDAAAESGELFPVFVPEFVIELRSPSDRPRPLEEKMEEYIENGVQLGWLISPNVTIYRKRKAPEILQSPSTVAGEGPLAGFVLDLKEIL